MYLYFDCFAGLDVFMTLGAIVNMTKEAESAQNIFKAVYPSAKLCIKELCRAQMKADRAFADALCDGEKSRDELLNDIEALKLSPFVKEKLCRYVSIKADASSVDPSCAMFCMNREMPELCAAAAIFDAVERLKIKKVLTSRILCSKSFTLTENGFEKITSPETIYISQKHALPISEAECSCELLTESGAALLAALGAAKASHTPGNASKIGYGAGNNDIPEIINILRLVVGTEGEEDILNFEMQFELSALCTTTGTQVCEKGNNP